jgi:serine/threonine-protein kinase
VDASSSERNPVEELAEEFIERCRRGEAPSIEEYTRRHPQWAERIRTLFPAMLDLERVRPIPADATRADGAAGRMAECPWRLGEYRILREVGRGGMGVVYEAEQESLGRRVALKVLGRHSVLDPRHLQRFQREARAAARLHHTNIVPVHGVGEQDGLHFYVMQFIQGLGLDAVLVELKRLRQAHRTGTPRPAEPRLAEPALAEPALAEPALAEPALAEPALAGAVATSLWTGRFAVGDAPAVEVQPAVAETDAKTGSSSSTLRLPGQAKGSSLSESGMEYWRSVARIGIQVADALAYAASQGVLHRDIKPSNLLLDTHGIVWVTDFGLAKAAGDEASLTNSGDVLGTVRYMAPERFQGEADARSDLYALGLTLYEMLTLRSAFDEANRDKLIVQVMHAEPPSPRAIDPTLPRDLETIVLKTIAREPGRRYAGAAELADDLQRFIDDRPIKARRLSPAQHAWRWCRRKPVVASLVGVLAVTVLAGFAGVLWQADRAEREKAVAQLERDEADKNFRQVLATIDRYCTQVSEDVLLNEPGMQPLRRKLLAAAREYYGEFVRQGSDRPQVRVELGRASQRLGTLTGEVESWVEALPHFQEAVALFDQLRRDFPSQADHVHQLATALHDLGDCYHRGERIDEARDAYRRALALEDELAANHPGAAQYKDQRARLHVSLGRLHDDQRQAVESRREYETARDMWLHLRQRYPDDRRYRERLGSVYAALGVLIHKTGPMEDAEAFFKSALELRAALAAEQQGVVRLQAALGQIHSSMGILYYDIKKLSQAEAAFDEALKVWVELATLNPRVSRFEIEKAAMYNKLGATRWRGGKAAPAADFHEKALAIRKRLADEQPQDPTRQRDLAETYNNLGLAYSQLGKKPEAEDAFRKTIAIFEPLVRDHRKLPDYRYRLALAHNNLGTVYRSERRWQDAEAAFLAATPLWEELVRDHEGIVDYARFSGASHYNLGLTYQDTDRIDLAEQSFRRALDTYETLSAKHPLVLDYATIVGKTYGRLGDMARDHGKPAEALPWFDRGQGKLEELLERDEQRTETREGLRNIHWGRALALADLDRHADAVKQWDRALAFESGRYADHIRLHRATVLGRSGDYAKALAETDAVLARKPTSGTLFYHAGVAHAAAAGAVQMDATVAPAERAQLAERYAARCVALLTEAQSAGYFRDAADFNQFRKNRVLAPLRERPDFQVMLRALNDKK